jgi:acyl-CoA synthetase (AMP-forming)/AMP-acid ligase II
MLERLGDLEVHRLAVQRAAMSLRRTMGLRGCRAATNRGRASVRCVLAKRKSVMSVTNGKLDERTRQVLMYASDGSRKNPRTTSGSC